MAGVRASDGAPIGGLEHMRQSVGKILNTRIGTRVLRRDFGSDVPNLLDRPIDGELRAGIYIATVEALSKWEPRLVIREIALTSADIGRVEMRITATYVPNGRPIELEGIVVR